MEAENQLEFVRKALDDLPRPEWQRIALDAKTNVRTLYNVVNPDRKPSYDTVFNVYRAIKQHAVSKAPVRKRRGVPA